MSVQTWEECLVTAQVDGTAYNTSTTATSIIPAAAKFTLPSNYFYIGKKLMIRASGRISATVSGPNLTLTVNFGATTIFAPAAFPLVARATTNVTWDLEISLICRAIGTSANMMGTGKLTSEACLGSAANVSVVTSMPLSSPVVGSNFDSTVTQAVDLVATWGTNSASNSIQLHMYSLEALN
jgi:hypothetical protein